jgi:hypothetical protein
VAPAVLERISEPLWLGGALRGALAVPAERRERIAALRAAARRRADAATELVGDRTLVAALLLEREALPLYVEALRLVRAAPDAEPAEAPAGALEALAGEPGLPPPSAELRELLAATDATALDRMPHERAVALLREAAALAHELDARIDVRSPRRIRLSRVVRVAIVAVALLGAVLVPVLRAGAPKNVARGVHVKASSRYPGTPRPDGVVDGETGGSYGVHTRVESAPWVSLDFGRVRPLSRVKIYNRGDGYFDDALPLSLELSNDGKSWQEVGRRETPFSQSSPWTVELGRRSTRFLRVSRASPGYIALSEIEAFE